ncbi:MAG: AraC family transcriptional regulator [Amphritea sp.]|nr:AraC family transcriptional regulator [Amphritea sp.]
MTNDFDLRMKGIDRDVVLSKSTEIIHSITGNSDEFLVYMMIDNLERNIKIQVCQRIFVNQFVFERCESSPSDLVQSAEGVANNMIRLESKSLRKMILHLLELREQIAPELQCHYIDIIFHYIESEVTFDNTFLESATSKQKVMEKLRSYIDQNIKHNLTIKSLMAICHMSERSLYYLFRESESTTPLSYIQQRKITRVHQDIKARESSHNITQLAMEYGFTNLGRFSQLYRKQVGELPSVTRSRAVSQALRV